MALRPRGSDGSALARTGWVLVAWTLVAWAGPVRAQGNAEAEVDAEAGADAEAEADGAHEDEGPPPTLVPPHLLEANAPAYPDELEDEAVEPTVLVHCVVETDGTVSSAHAETPHEGAFDRAAVEAVLTWRFEPAMRGGVPIRAAVRVSVRFESPMPHFDLAGTHNRYGEGEEAHNTDDARPHLDPEPERSASVGAETAPIPVPEFSARATVDPLETARAARAASTYALDRALLDLAPRRDAADMIGMAPGVLVTRPEGEAVAPRIYLRGFDADHGQDLAISAGGVPLNQPSHVHGQGYADLGFVIPEAVRGVRVTEGVYDPRQGDFATAGSIDFDLGLSARGLHLGASYGSFHTFRALALWAPNGEREETFAGASYRRTDGFGVGRAGESGNVLGQVAFGEGRVRFRLLTALSASRAGGGSVVRRDDVVSGAVDLYGAYAVPAAAGQGTSATRALAAGFVEIRGDDGSFGEIGLFGTWGGFRYTANFTGYVETDPLDPTRRPGDRVEQRDEAFSLGVRARYRTPRFTPFEWLEGALEVGATGRLDLREQAVSGIEAAPSSVAWDPRIDASVRALDVGAYLDLDLHLTEHVRARGGVRGDLLDYGIDDRLVPGARSASGLVGGPRATLEWAPIRELTLSVAYGEGYRSPQALSLLDGASAAFAKVHSGDVGARLRLGERDELTASVTGFLTAVSRELAFEPEEGVFEEIGASVRIGVTAFVVVRPWSFLTGQLSATYVDVSVSPVPGAEPGSPHGGGARPFVAPFTLRADLGVAERLFDLEGAPVRGRIGAGVSVLSSRPLANGESSEPIGLLDASASVSWHGVELGVDVLNATGSRYAAVEYSFASNWSGPSSPGSDVPARHLAAGAPLTVMGRLGVTIP